MVIILGCLLHPRRKYPFFFFFFGSILSKLAPRHCHPIIQSGWQLLGGISYNRIIRSHGHTSIAYPSGCKMNFLVFCVTMQDSVLVAETFWKPLNNDIGKANQNLWRAHSSQEEALTLAEWEECSVTSLPPISWLVSTLLETQHCSCCWSVGPSAVAVARPALVSKSMDYLFFFFNCCSLISFEGCLY